MKRKWHVRGISQSAWLGSQGVGVGTRLAFTAACASEAIKAEVAVAVGGLVMPGTICGRVGRAGQASIAGGGLRRAGECVCRAVDAIPVDVGRVLPGGAWFAVAVKAVPRDANAILDGPRAGRTCHAATRAWQARPDKVTAVVGVVGIYVALQACARADAGLVGAGLAF